MKSNKKLSLIILFLLSVFIFIGGIQTNASANGKGIIKPAQTPPPGSIFYGGIITEVSTSSITLYSGKTIYITGNTKCEAPTPNSHIMKNMAEVSCSELKKGETVQVEAVKNLSGELEAVLIKEVFY